MSHDHVDGSVTAERVGLDPTSPFWAEHRSRYRFAGEAVRNRRVLDVACGTGLGAELLRHQGARLIVGMDLSAGALEHARGAAVPVHGLVRADGTRLPVPDHALDAVVSFETLEHLDADDEFIAELRRVLQTDGLLILSTPNAFHTRPVNGVPSNPHHFREYTPDELERLLRRHFSTVRLLGQRTTESYGVSPFWEHRDNLPTDLKGRVSTLSWKILARVPPPLRDRAEKLLRNRAFYPTEFDFSFREDDVMHGHVLVAVCHP